MTSPSTTTIDAVGGSAVSVLSMLLIAWAIGSVLTASSFPAVVTQVDDSAVLSTMDKVMPSQAKTMFSEFRRLLASGPFPQVFSGIGAAPLFAVSPPDPAVLNAAGYQAARSRVLKVDGTAPSCDRSIEGSGFVYAPDHILTNAHVVAGVTQGLTVTTPAAEPPQGIRHLPLPDFPMVTFSALWLGKLSPLAEMFLEEATVLAKSLLGLSVAKRKRSD